MTLSINALLFALLALAGVSSAQAQVSTEIRALDGVTRSYEGPNCFSLALMQALNKPDVRYVSSEELAWWLKSPRCQELADTATKQEGDIVVLYAGRLDLGTEEHAFIYMDEKTAFSKNGYDHAAPYKIQDLKGVLKLYEFSAKDWNANRCTSNATSNKKCKKQARVFRCAQTPAEVALSETSQKVLKAEAKIQKSLLSAIKENEGTLGSYDRQQLLSQVEDQKWNAEEETASLKGAAAFGAQSVVLRIESLNQWINDLND